MPASRASRLLLLSVFSLTLTVGLAPATASASTALPLPDVMAAVGDSITQAASSAGVLGANAPQNSWATGTSSSVNSHYLRLLAAGAQISGQNHNRSVSGAKMAGLNGQMANVVGLQPDYLTVLIGGNDVCTPTEAQMTSVADFRAQFQAAMATLRAGSPGTNVYVVSIPRVMGLYELFRGNWWARFIWSTAGVCQSLLANPTSTAQVDVERRARVAARNEAFNQVLADVCVATPRCLWDGGAAFSTVFEAADVSGDYFHPSAAGQAKLAAVSWASGYTWTAAPAPNQPPSAAFTAACSGLTCNFANTSTDVDGTMTHAWDFDDGTLSAETSPSHTYGAAGTFTVTLTVTDDDLASATTSQSVTVTSPTMSIQSLAYTASNVNNKNWRATVTITVRDGTGAVLPNAVVSGDWTVGTSDTCTTGPAGSCTVTSDNLNRRNVPSVTFTVAAVTRAGYTYSPAANAVTFIVVPRP